MYTLYRALTRIIEPAVPLLLQRRLSQGKEDAERMKERLGHASLARPEGKLLWLHAASVGESNAVLPLIAALLDQHPNLHVLLTTVTVTSAALMRRRLPGRALHQFAPVDTPGAVARFLKHWKPDVALWVDSELWPNLIHDTHASGAVLGIVNARLSERSFRRWQRAGGFVRRMLGCFNFCFAQSEADAERLRALGLKSITGVGNLKYDAPPLPFDEQELGRLQAETGDRPLWVAASTHPGEEAMAAEVHYLLKAQLPDVLTVIVPRHATRGRDIAQALAPLNIARRSGGEPVTPATDIYLADTMGELGLFYRLAPAAFIGGSLIAHGGQNPLEAARLRRAIIAGPHMHSFAAIAAAMEKEEAILRVEDTKGLAGKLILLLKDPAACAALGERAHAHVKAHAGMLGAITRGLQPFLV